MVGLWLSLALLLAAIVGGTAFAALRGLQLYRTVKRTRGAFASRLDGISQSVSSIERQLAAAEAGMQRLGEAQRRLQLARARLDVQRAALREARTQVRRVLWFVPGL